MQTGVPDTEVAVEAAVEVDTQAAAVAAAEVDTGFAAVAAAGVDTEVGVVVGTAAELASVADTEAQVVVVSVVVVVVAEVVVEVAVPSPHMVCRISGKTDLRLSIAFRNAYSTSWLMVIMR